MNEKNYGELLERVTYILADLADAAATGGKDEYELLLDEARKYGGHEATDTIRAFIVHSRWMMDVGIPSIVRGGFDPERLMRDVEKNRVDAQARQRYVYFLRRPDGFIKIGSAFDVDARMRSIGNISGHQLELIGYVKGDYSAESSLHNEFSSNRAIGEWFSPSDELIARIETLISNERALLDAEMQPQLFKLATAQ